MFTGLVQETGTIAELRQVRAKDGKILTRISVAAKAVPRELKTGDSVAVSGVCLTALDIRRRQFSAELAEETLRRTSLARLKKGSVVNLELPARLQDRLGGHIVQGHVDGTGRLISLTTVKDRDDWRLTMEIPSWLTKYVVAQGSISMEGISLTVATIEGDRVEVAIIPHTYEATNVQHLKAGDPVNIEVDVLAKYAEKMIAWRGERNLTKEELIRRGF